MGKAVLVQKTQSDYDDRPGEVYHFPKRYLKRIEAAKDDWIVFYRPVKDAGVSDKQRGHYFAVAQLGEARPDQLREDHFYVDLIPETFLEFSTPVPRLWDGHFVESRLDGGDGKANSGVSQNAVRELDDVSFQRILRLGWRSPAWEIEREEKVRGVAESAAEFDHEDPRQIERELTERTVRDRRFRSLVLSAYERRCAVTGWQFVNGGGRAEVQAAHIKPVSERGPDSVRNGLALSATVHWMFDRGMIGVNENSEICVHRKVNNQDEVARLINNERRLLLPSAKEYHPHPEFLRWHWDHHKFAA